MSLSYARGDPFFYGSFMHLYRRLHTGYPVEVIPAITGMSAAWTATGQPITWGDDTLSVLMGTLDEVGLAKRFAETDAAVVMKIGRNLEKIKRALISAGRIKLLFWLNAQPCRHKRSAVWLTMTAICALFSIIILHGRGRAP